MSPSSFADAIAPTDSVAAKSIGGEKRSRGGAERVGRRALSAGFSSVIDWRVVFWALRLVALIIFLINVPVDLGMGEAAGGSISEAFGAAGDSSISKKLGSRKDSKSGELAVTGSLALT